MYFNALKKLSIVAFALATCSAFATAPVTPPVDCGETLAALDRKIQNGESYKSLKEALNSDPAVRCSLNRTAGLDREYASRAQEIARSNKAKECDPSLCMATYQRVKALFGEYKEKLMEGCKIAAEAGKKCTSSDLPSGESARFTCIANEYRKAAEAEKGAATLITNAKAEAEQYSKMAAEVSGTYARDKKAIKPFEAREDLATAKAIRGGELDTRAPDILERIQAKESTGTISGGQVLAVNGGAQNLRTYYSNADKLALEQNNAALAATGFSDFAKEEAAARNQSVARLRTLAAENDLRASGQRPDPSNTSVKNSGSKLTGNANTTGASVMPNLNNATALTGQSAALAKQLSQQPAAASSEGSSFSQGASLPESFSGIPQAAQSLGISSLGKVDSGSRTASVQTPGENPAAPATPIGKDDVSVNPVATGGNETFVSGTGDLPPADGASVSGRSIATARSGKVDSSGGAETSPGRKKKTDEKMAAGCGSDKECMAAMGLETLQFNKAGSLGAPVIGASDAGLGTVGALDNLFGPLPGEDAFAKPGALPAPAAQNWDFVSGTSGVNNSTPDAAVQSGVEVAPAHSRSLFSRVRIVHERALKKGAVSLFHKKL